MESSITQDLSSTSTERRDVVACSAMFEYTIAVVLITCSLQYCEHSKKEISHPLCRVTTRQPRLDPKITSHGALMTSTSSDVCSPQLHTTFLPDNPISLTYKRYKAPLSVESRSKNLTKTKSAVTYTPGTPTKRSGTPSNSRSQTPVSSRKGAESPFFTSAMSEMDVSNVDPESVLVDYQMVEEEEVSGEIDDSWLQAAMNNHGKRDKVMVSVRLVLIQNPTWI